MAAAAQKEQAAGATDEGQKCVGHHHDNEGIFFSSFLSKCILFYLNRPTYLWLLKSMSSLGDISGSVLPEGRASKRLKTNTSNNGDSMIPYENLTEIEQKSSEEI